MRVTPAGRQTLPGMHIRPATADDLDALVALGHRFFAFSRFVDFVAFDAAAARAALVRLMDTGLVLVAEAADGQVAGGIAGMLAPVWFNPGARMAAELGWWVDDAYRGSLAGVKLAWAFEQWGREQGAVAVSMSDLVIDGATPAGPLFERLGYRVVERCQVKGV